ncbi:MAG: glycosyltransferase [Thermodesulfobacteriota bacterium]
MPRISIVIRCYNEEKYIGRLLTGISQQTVRDTELIIVDSGSTDATISIVQRFPVKLIQIRPEDFSFGYSLNTGCRAAAGDIIVIASAHVYPVYIDWLEKLVAPFADPDIAIVYGKQRGNDRSKFSERELFAKWFPEKSDTNQKHPFCNNANAAIRKSLWHRLPYDESLTGLEDLDWATRAIASGYRIVYQSDALVVHVHNETPRATYNRYRREAMAFKRISEDEHFTRKDFFVLFFSNVMSDYVNAFREGVFAKKWFEIIGFRLMQFYGTYRGFAESRPVTSQLKRTFYYSNHIRQRPVPPLERGNNQMVDYRSGGRLYREDN